MKKQQWTEAETERLIALYKAGVTVSELARRFNRSIGSINGKIDYMMLPRQTVQRAWTNHEKAKAIRLRQKGASVAEIAEKLGRGKTSVRYAMRGHL